MIEARQRKHPRLKKYDYTQSGAYFVTICTKNRVNILSHVTAAPVGRDDFIPPTEVKLTFYGKAVAETIFSIPKTHLSVIEEKHVIMPNHVHLLLTFSSVSDGDMRATQGGMKSSCPTLMTVVRVLKSRVTLKTKQSIWQDGFYEHIIRDEQDFLRHQKYMEDNPAKWAEDEYYVGLMEGNTD
ncbi:MAG TPA: hypothetical protein VN608_10485 [Clostridia bacterium]|nr:hypothetical protein [Clostridia bacterium]